MDSVMVSSLKLNVTSVKPTKKQLQKETNKHSAILYWSIFRLPRSCRNGFWILFSSAQCTVTKQS